MKKSPLSRINDSNGYQRTQKFEGNFIPFEASTPHHNRNRGNWQSKGGNRNQQYSGGYNQQRSYGNNPQSPYSPYKNAKHFGQRPKRFGNQSSNHIPISKYTNIKLIFEDPWCELQKNLDSSVSLQTDSQASEIDTSTDLVTESSGLSQDSICSNNDDSLICKDQSSIDLELDGMNFSQDSVSAKSE